MFIYELFEGNKYKCTCLPNDKDPDCPKHGLEPMDVGDALDEQGVAENKAAGIDKMFNNLGDPVYANLQRVALLAMQGRQSEAAGRLQTVIKDADPAVQKKITDAVNNIKPVTINGRVADSSTLDKSKQHNDWITNTFIPWVQSLLGQQGMAEGKKPDNYHIVNKDGKPASLASYADRASAEKDRDAKHPGAEVRQVGPRGKVKGVSEGATGAKSLGLHYPTNNEAKQRLDPKCWTGYKKQGTKMKGGVRVNNCVPVEEENKGLYYNVNKRKKAGTSRDADHPKAPTAQAWKDAAKTAKK